MTTIVGVRFQRPSALHQQDKRVYNYKTAQECAVGDHAVVVLTDGILKIVEIVEVPSTHVFEGTIKWLLDVIQPHGEPK